MKLLLTNYINAKLEGKKEGYDIKTVEDDNYESYYILFKPRAGIYRDQYHILEMKTRYGNGQDTAVYPYNAPLVKFLTKVYHTNISTSGSICLDILKEKAKWVPTYDFNAIIMNILLLFSEPNNASPFNSEASRAYVDCANELKGRIKGQTLTVEEVDQQTAECFQPFKTKADQYASDNKLSDYTRWFPQLEGKDSDESKETEELESLRQMLDSLKIKKKANVVTEETVPITTPDNKQAVPKPNKWAKYQKK